MTAFADDHHWFALWLLLAGGILATCIGHESTFAGILIGAGCVWLWLVD
jgi:hypothetical protein